MQDIVNAICDDEDIKAVSFVGSNTVSFCSEVMEYILLPFRFHLVLECSNTTISSVLGT